MPDQPPPLLAMRQIGKRFAGVRALSGVSLEVRAGEVHGICGENGAGKSTLMKIISGVLAPDEGVIEFEGRPVRLDSPQQARSLGIVMIHQELNLVPQLTVAENIWLAREPCRGPFVDRARQREGARACLARLGAGIDPEARVATLPIAQQQMVEIAKALSMQARLLIMDEPTSSLDEADSQRLLAVVAELQRDGVAVLYISHRFDELARIAGHVTVLRDGCHVRTMRWAETTLPEVVALMVGRTLDQQFPAPTRVPGDEPLLQVRGLRREGVFGPVDFEVRRGEILGFAGLIGAGRTEVARALFGADTADGGDVRVAGQPVSISSPIDAIRAGLAYLPEDRKAHGLALQMGVGSNISIASLGRLSRRGGFIDFARERSLVAGSIRRLAIRAASPEQPARQLSGGNQQKVVLAKWLARTARVLLFDEPTRGVDVGAKQALYVLMDELAAQGVGVVLISSELPEILGLCDRIAVFRDGNIAATLAARATTQEEIMYIAAVGTRKPAGAVAGATTSAMTRSA